MKKIFYLLPVLLLCFFLAGCQTNIDSDVKSTVVVISIAGISVLFIILSAYSNILRDEISNMDEFNANAQQLQQKRKWKLPGSNAPFDLTKVQFGLWTVIISSVYIYMSFFKGDCATGTINKTALVLMGIFAGTAVASTIIDKNEINNNTPRHQNRPSQGFFIDILSDANGISLHRFQNFAWTIIAIAVYLYKVSQIKTGCELPELSDTLLALTGISSATYLVLKTQENNAATIAPNTQAAPTSVSNNSNIVSTEPFHSVAT